MIPPTYKPKKKFMQRAIAEAKRARDRGDYPIGAVVTRLIGKREVVIASAGSRVKTSGSSIKHVELETSERLSAIKGLAERDRMTGYGPGITCNLYFPASASPLNIVRCGFHTA